jgi:tetratricopeptide (TPR) repeat protein
MPGMTGPATAQTLPPSLQSDFEAGSAALKAERLDEAEKAFLRVLRKGGKVGFVYNNLGIVYQIRGDHKRAIVQFREAIRLQPDYAAPRVLLGASLLATGQDAEATRELERAVKIQPNEPTIRLQLAHAYERTANYTGLVEQYQTLHSLRPDDAEFLYQLGRAYLEQADWCMREIKKIDPQSVRLYLTLGEKYRARERLDLAAAAYKRAAQIAPSLPGIHLELAQVYLQQGQAAEAQQEIQKELAIVPESTAAQALAKKIAAEVAK